ADNFIKKYGRTFSDDPEKVARHAMEFIAAHRKYGIITTLKHFPGHGSADGDSHLGLVNVTHTWNRSELEPYKIIIDSGMCDGVMTAHILNFRLGTDSLPATLSAQVINGLLRDTLGFDGVVFSDDMQMRAISDFYGMKKAIRLSIEAGVDVLIFSHNIAGTTDQKAERVFNVIKKLVEDGEISRERIEQSYNRIMKLKEKYIIRNI
ncbi:MAG: glycoside hydrolase family 3 protein, partial [Bacteroidetes bacterium]|nr:glycoside hydrolase family 3 protein [Bacteroidota bacterium]